MDDIGALEREMTMWHHHLHAHPETGFDGGIGVATRSPWILIHTLALLSRSATASSRPREAYLERRFGDAYRDYKARVRRWPLRRTRWLPRRASAYATNRGTPHYRLLSEAKPHSPAVAQTVDFGLARSKMLYLSIRVD